MNIGTQYYRPPFPNQSYWQEDLRRMAETGLEVVQLWVVWGWVESQPGKFVYDDYDRLIELADQQGLKVLLSTIAAIQPHWILREEPGCNMVNHLGQEVVSGHRIESHFGITPGGCFDHPGCHGRMMNFLSTTGQRYAGVEHLLGWDVWNELRWAVHANGRVCFCEHTLEAYRRWLDEQFDGLEGLNARWERRYGCWEDVMPSRYAARPFTDGMAFGHFLTVRSNRHGRDRIETLRQVDPNHPVTLHADCPGPLRGRGEGSETVLCRGNDWDLAEAGDAFGTSSFPLWQANRDTSACLDFAARIETVRSACQQAGTGRIWLSELQGGSVADTRNAYLPVPANTQQKWLWSAKAAGAETAIFWCWRDEVFGPESSGFGLAGDDGLAEERLEAMRHTADILKTHRALFDAYRADHAEVAVLFSPTSQYCDFAQQDGDMVAHEHLAGTLAALYKRSIPFDLVEETRLETLAERKVLILPYCIALRDETTQRIREFAEQGGVVVADSHLAAWDERGIFRYRPDRFYVQPTGLREHRPMQLQGQRLTADIAGQAYELQPTRWLTPLTVPDQADVHARTAEDMPLIASAAWGKGRLVLIGTWLGYDYRNRLDDDYDAFLAKLCSSARGTVAVDWQGDPRSEYVSVRTGRSGQRRMAFVFFSPQAGRATLQFPPDFWAQKKLTDLISGETCQNEDDRVVMDTPAREMAVLVDA